jgi:dDENN domain
VCACLVCLWLDLRKVAFRRKHFKKADSQKLAATFLRFLVTQTVHYKEHLHGSEVDRPAFIASGRPESRPFLTLLAGAQMFERFVEEEVKLGSYGGVKRCVYV